MKSAQEIDRQLRAFEEWPGIYTGFNGKQLKILEAELSSKNTDYKAGEVFLTENKELAVQAKDGILILKKVQLEGKKEMSALDEWPCHLQSKH